jgi:hypothetical protein
MPPSPPYVPQTTATTTLSQQPVHHTFSEESPSTLLVFNKNADHSAQFRCEFQSLIQNNKFAKRSWVQFQKKYKSYCSNKRCIKLVLAFCSHYGKELVDLSKHSMFRKLGSRSNCHCSISSPLSHPIATHSVPTSPPSFSFKLDP